MGLYLTTWTATGTGVWQPTGTVGVPYTCIDLRPDPTVGTGYALVNSPATLSGNGVTVLPDLDATLPAVAKTIIANKLGLSGGALATSSTLRQVAQTLLMAEGGAAGRWKRVTADGGRYRIWLGELISDLPYIAGGASVTETFNTANSTTLGPNLTWVERAGDWSIVGNQAWHSTAADWGYAVASTDLGSVDHYAEVDVQSARSTGVLCRASTTENTHYNVIADGSSVSIERWVAGVGTVLTIGTTISNRSTSCTIGRLRGEVNGSTIRALWDGQQVVAVTDTGLTDNPRAGIAIYGAGGSAAWTVDNFAAGALTSQVALGQAVESDTTPTLTTLVKQRTVSQVVDAQQAFPLTQSAPNPLRAGATYIYSAGAWVYVPVIRLGGGYGYGTYGSGPYGG